MLRFAKLEDNLKDVTILISTNHMMDLIYGHADDESSVTFVLSLYAIIMGEFRTQPALNYWNTANTNSIISLIQDL